MLFFGILAVAALAALILGPQFLINWTMNKHAVHRDDMPGTGGELARHLLNEAGLTHIKLEVTDKMGDHYSTDEKTVRLSEANMNGKSITAVAVAVHEVAHAIQDRDGYAPLMLRQRLVKKTIVIERIGSVILMLSPLVFMLTRNPAAMLLEIFAALGIMACTIVVHIFTLPTEFDASFKKALPVLENYLPVEEMKGARAVLRAAAFTYVASALISLLNVARWFRLLRF